MIISYFSFTRMFLFYFCCFRRTEKEIKVVVHQVILNYIDYKIILLLLLLILLLHALARSAQLKVVVLMLKQSV